MDNYYNDRLALEASRLPIEAPAEVKNEIYQRIENEAVDSGRLLEATSLESEKATSAFQPHFQMFYWFKV